MVRIFVLAFVVNFGNEPCAQKNDAADMVGEQIAITMTGDLAKQYATRTESLPNGQAPGGLQIETSATIEQKLDDGKVRIEHASYVRVTGKPIRLVTLSGTVDASRITTDVTPKGAQVYGSPGSKSVPLTSESKTLRLELSELKGLRLRTWTLSEEIGD